MLTPAETERFKQRLEVQRAALLRRIESLEQMVASPDKYAEAMQERGDDATFLDSHEEAEDEIVFARKELGEVDRALARIADGTYGLSVVSGEPIPRERLEALPTAITLVGETPPE